MSATACAQFTSTPITGFRAPWFRSNTLLTAAGAAKRCRFRGNSWRQDTCHGDCSSRAILFPWHRRGKHITVRVPITVFPEASLRQPDDGGSARYCVPRPQLGTRVTYYAVSQGLHVPRRRSVPQLHELAQLPQRQFRALARRITNRYAILALAAAASPEPPAPTDVDRRLSRHGPREEEKQPISTVVFEQKRFSKTFNDRFVNVSP
jgi:hypothetical protein